MKKIVFLLPFCSLAVLASTDTVKPSALARQHKKVVEVLKLKGPDQTHGQVLSPGQKPGTTTLAEAEKYAARVATIPTVVISTPTHER